MKVHLAFVPPNGGETDYWLEFDLPSIPQVGDYIQIYKNVSHETEDFIVRRTIWKMKYPQPNEEFIPVVECEFVRSHTSSESHITSCNSYKVEKEMDVTVY